MAIALTGQTLSFARPAYRQKEAFLMNTPHDISRRDLLKRTVQLGVAGAAAPRLLSTRAAGQAPRPGPNERIQVGLIGAGGQGNWNLDQLLEQPDVAVTAVCDVWKERLDKTLAKCGGTARGYGDYRDVLRRDDVDAVLIATPPHWHALMAIDAAEAGKDFYLEKPMTLSVGEGLAVRRAVAKHKRITQIGTQIHATPNYRRIVDILRSGVLGKISVARTFHVLNQGPEGIGNVPDSAPPEGLDWDMWLGPGPKRAFNRLLAKDAYYHSSFMAYSGGWTPGMAPHLIDLPCWALELGCPTCASSSGGRYLIHDAGDAYDFHEVLWQYPDFTMAWTTSLINSYGFDNQGEPGTRRRRGIYFQGVNGTLIGDYELLKIVPEGDRMKSVDVDAVPKVIPDSPGHHREWLDGIHTRRPPSCHVGYHYKIDVAINLSLMSLKLGRSVRFDPASETIPNDPEAAKLLLPVYREPWKLPAEYL
jgi:predicted dehydrogenase